MTLRYTLIEQVHFLGQADGQPTLVTMQRWDALRAARRRSIHVIANDGVVKHHKLCQSTEDINFMDAAMDLNRKTNALLTERQARTVLAERTGAVPAWCERRYCDGCIPIAADRCEHGHPIGQVAAGALSGVRRRPIILHTGAPSDG